MFLKNYSKAQVNVNLIYSKRTKLEPKIVTTSTGYTDWKKIGLEDLKRNTKMKDGK